MDRKILFEIKMIQCRDAQIGPLYIDIDMPYQTMSL
jgi:hypothetical protein